MADDFDSFYNTIISSNLEVDALSKKIEEAKQMMETLVMRRFQVKQEGEKLQHQVIVKRRQLSNAEISMTCGQCRLVGMHDSHQECEKTKDQLQQELEEVKREHHSLQQTFCRELGEFNATYGPLRAVPHLQAEQTRLRESLALLLSQESALQAELAVIASQHNSINKLKEEKSQLQQTLEGLQKKIADLELSKERELKALKREGWGVPSNEQLLRELRMLRRKSAGGRQRFKGMREQLARLEQGQARKPAAATFTSAAQLVSMATRCTPGASQMPGQKAPETMNRHTVSNFPKRNEHSAELSDTELAEIVELFDNNDDDGGAVSSSPTPVTAASTSVQKTRMQPRALFNFKRKHNKAFGTTH